MVSSQHHRDVSILLHSLHRLWQPLVGPAHRTCTFHKTNRLVLCHILKSQVPIILYCTTCWHSRGERSVVWMTCELGISGLFGVNKCPFLQLHPEVLVVRMFSLSQVDQLGRGQSDGRDMWLPLCQVSSAYFLSIFVTVSSDRPTPELEPHWAYPRTVFRCCVQTPSDIPEWTISALFPSLFFTVMDWSSPRINPHSHSRPVKGSLFMKDIVTKSKSTYVIETGVWGVCGSGAID